MLREVGLVEQRYQAVREVLNDAASVTAVARRNGESHHQFQEPDVMCRVSKEI